MVEPRGSSAAQWAGTIFPRIRECLPADTILEIAPGFGRWTHYLKDYCNELWAVDKSSNCIEACQQRFASISHVRCYLNDGRSLSMIPDASWISFSVSIRLCIRTETSSKSICANLERS